MSSSAARARKRRAARVQHRSIPIFAIVAMGIVALFALAILLTRSGDDPGTAGGGVTQETAAVEIAGDSLPRFTDGSSTDDAVGLPFPEVTGETFAGEPISITADGTPKMIVFVAHWCPHCQVEVPVIQAWLDSGAAPDGLDIVTVATSTSEGQPNYPPSAWLEREGWTPPVLLDNTAYAVGDAFGLSSYPFFVFTDADGNVTARTSGELPVAQMEELIAQARS